MKMNRLFYRKRHRLRIINVVEILIEPILQPSCQPRKGEVVKYN